MPNANREAAAARIRALLSKTIANGCTESEALAAAAKAGELMDRYALTFSDVEIKQEKCEKRHATEKRHEVTGVASAIARYCGCMHWRDAGRIIYYGLQQDIEIADYFTEMCRSAMEAGFRVWMRSSERPIRQDGRALRRPFMFWMAQRLSERFDKLAEVREATARTATGTALVLVKNAVVQEQFENLGIKLYSCAAPRFRDNGAAARAGTAAGDRVNISAGIRAKNPINLVS